MSDYGGYVFLFDEPKRVEILGDRLNSERVFTDTISAPDWKPKDIEVCLVSFDGASLSYACLVRRGNKVATAKYRIEFSRFINFVPIRFDELGDSIPHEFRQHLIQASKGSGSRVPPGTWAQVVGALKRLRPGEADRLDELDKYRRASKADFTAAAYKVVAQEKDAVGLAVSIFGLERTKVLGGAVPDSAGKPAPFIKLLRQATLREDTMLGHDSKILPGWEAIEQYQVGATEFQRDKERLTVMNVNRTSIEQTLGVDLIYYHHRFESFVMVQYKRMTQDDTGRYLYRPTDASYKAELERMRTVKAQLEHEGEGITKLGYRLNTEAFYFKLCEEISFTPLSNELIRGMYLPLDYWEILTAAPESRGVRGGLALGHDNVDRHLTNTVFIEMVQRGWIGSRAKSTAFIQSLIEQSLSEDHSVIVAVSKPRDEDEENPQGEEL